jgi:hypothetical protein
MGCSCRVGLSGFVPAEMDWGSFGATFLVNADAKMTNIHVHSPLLEHHQSFKCLLVDVSVLSM